MAGACAFGRKGNRIADRSGNHPDARFALVLFFVWRANGVGDPSAFRVDLWAVNFMNQKIVCDGDGTRGVGRLLGESGGGERTQNCEDKQSDCLHVGVLRKNLYEKNGVSLPQENRREGIAAALGSGSVWIFDLCSAATMVRKNLTPGVFFCCAPVQTLYSFEASLLSRLRREQASPKEDD